VNGDSQSYQIHYKAEFRGNARNDKSAQRILDKLELSHRRSGDTLTILTRTSKGCWDGSGQIDLILSVPSSLELEINDSSGSILDRDMDQSVHIADRSGSITLELIGADVRINDRSGGIQVRDVGGSADIQDSSGGIRVVDVAHNIVISDSSGGISVLSVGNDFEVTRDTSGGIRYDGVKRKVRIP